MKGLKKLLLICIFASIPFFTFAENWFVCLGSFKNLKNAEEFALKLKKSEVPCFIYYLKSEKGSLYRVLFKEQFKEASDARSFKNGLSESKKIKALKLGELWICKADVDLKVPVKTKKTEIPSQPSDKPAVVVKPVEEKKNPVTVVPSEVSAVEKSEGIVEKAAQEPESVKEPEVKDVSEAVVIPAPAVEKSENVMGVVESETPVENVKEEMKAEEAVESEVPAESEIPAEEKVTEEEKVQAEPAEAEEKPLAVEKVEESNDEKPASEGEGEKSEEKTEEKPKTEAELIKFDSSSESLFINDTSEIQLSSDVPYSVLVKKFRNEKDARMYQELLNKTGRKSFVVKTLVEEEGIEFNLLCGTYTDDYSAEDEMAQMGQEGIQTSGVVNYNDLVDPMYAYDEMIDTTGAANNSGIFGLPAYFNHEILSVIRYVPNVAEYHCDKVVICDLENLREEGKSNPVIDELAAELPEVSKAKAASVTFLHNGADKSACKVYVIAGENGTFGSVTGEENEFNFTASDDNGSVVVRSVNGKGNVCVLARTENLSSASRDSFEKGFKLEGGLFDYPSFRKNISILPVQGEKVPGKFICYTDNAIDDNYIYERGFEGISKAVSGGNCSTVEYVQDGVEFDFSAVDLTYDYNASNAYRLFVNERNELPQNDFNHSVELSNNLGWFMNNAASGQELIFQFNSFIITVTSKDMNEEELIDAGKSSHVWVEE